MDSLLNWEILLEASYCGIVLLRQAVDIRDYASLQEEGSILQEKKIVSYHLSSGDYN